MKGGKRAGAGRKPCTEKKQQMTIYVKTSQIEKLGKDEIRQICEKAINEAVLKYHITKTLIKKFQHNATTFMLIIDSIPEMTKDREIVYFEQTAKSVHHNKVKEIQCPAGHVYQPDDVLFLADRIRDIESKIIIKEIDIDF